MVEASEWWPMNASSAPESFDIVLSNQRQGLRFLLREMWDFRDLLYFLVIRDLKPRYRQTVFGVLWVLAPTLFTATVFTAVFGFIAKVPSNDDPYALFVLAGLVPWTFFSSSTQIASGSLISYAYLLSKVYFPRLFIPLAPMIARSMDFFVGICVVLVATSVHQGGLSVRALFLIPISMLVFVTALALGLCLCAIGLKYRDVSHASSFMLQLMMYAAPVVWPLEMLKDVVPESLMPLLGLFPMVACIAGFRASLLGGPMPWAMLGVATLTALLGLLVGLLLFVRLERSFADVA